MQFKRPINKQNFTDFADILSVTMCNPVILLLDKSNFQSNYTTASYFERFVQQYAEKFKHNYGKKHWFRLFVTF